jgi:2-methylcitrate dehydratase PrpD
MTAPTPAQQVAAFATQAMVEGLPAVLRDDLAGRVVDLLGNCLAALREEPAAVVADAVSSWGGTGAATAIGLPGEVPAPSAALVNGTLAHALDFDDTHLPSVLHPSSAVIPAALAVAEQAGASGTAFLDAAAIGIEMTCRLGMAGYDESAANSVFFDRGQHATAICGTVGAAVAAGLLQNLGADALTSAIGIACSMGSGVIEANRTGGTVKRVHCGWAAHAGVVAADFARCGLTGPPTVLEGRFGFLQAFCGDRFDITRVTDGLGDRWETLGIFFKPYPCNHFTHAGIDAALRLRRAGIDPHSAVRLTLGVPAPVLHTIGEPVEEKKRPRTGYHGAFSGPYTVAAAFLGGSGLGLFYPDFTDDAVADPARLALADKVDCVPDERCTAIFPRQFPAVLTAQFADGRAVTEQVLQNRGGPASPLSEQELTTKFHLNAERAVPGEAAQRIASLAWDLRSHGRVADVTAELRALTADHMIR